MFWIVPLVCYFIQLNFLWPLSSKVLTTGFYHHLLSWWFTHFASASLFYCKYSFLFDVNSSASGKYVSVSRSILWSSKALRYMASPSAKIWSTILEVDCKTAHEFAARLRFVMSGEDWHSNKVYVMAKFLPQATGNFDSCTVTHARIIIGRVPLTRVPACSSGHPPFILRSSIAKIEIETGCIVVPRPPRQD